VQLYHGMIPVTRSTVFPDEVSSLIGLRLLGYDYVEGLHVDDDVWVKEIGTANETFLNRTILGNVTVIE
jgi:hypothetical protein